MAARGMFPPFEFKSSLLLRTLRGRNFIRCTALVRGKTNRVTQTTQPMSLLQAGNQEKGHLLLTVKCRLLTRAQSWNLNVKRPVFFCELNKFHRM